MPTNSYDLIVLGDDFPGLVAGTLCARRGMRVLLAPTGHRQLSYSLGNHRLPVYALPFIGMSSPAIKRVLEELHFDHLLKRKLRQPRPAFQLVSPDARIDVIADEEALARELIRELPGAPEAAATCEGASSIARFLDPVLGEDVTFPPAGFWERREVSRSAIRLDEEAEEWFASIDQDPMVRALLEAPAVLGTCSAPDALSAQNRARSFELWRQGTPRLGGDWQALNDLFLEKLTSHSGEVRAAAVEEILFSWGKAVGVRLDTGEELGAEHIIAALPVADLMALTESKRPKRLAQCAEKIAPAGYRYTLNFLVAQAGIPEGMASTVLVVGDPEQPLEGANAFAIFLDEADADAQVVVTVEAMCPAPADDDQLDDALADLRVGLRQQIELVMPFFSEHVLLAHSPHEAVPAEGGHADLELDSPIPPQPVWKSSLESYLGVSAVPYMVGVKHLTVASTQVLPGLGLEGDFAAGWCAAKIACAAAGKKRDVSRDDLLATSRR